MFDTIEIINKKRSKKIKYISISDYIENNCYELRDIFSEFIHNMSVKHLKDEKYKTSLLIDNDPLIFWMSLIYEKNFYKSPSISNCIKLLAVEKILKIEKPYLVKFNCSERKMARLIQDLCQKYNIIFLNNYNHKFSITIKKIKTLIPNIIRSLIYLTLYYFYSIKFRKIKTVLKKERKKLVLFFSYFTHITFDKKNKMKSNQWENLPKLVREKGLSIYWLHFNGFLKEKDKTRASLKIFDDINKNSKLDETHVFLESFLTFNVFIRTMIIYMRIYFKSFFLKPNKEYFLLNKSKVNLYDLLLDDWNDSFSGITLIQNISWIILFKEALKFFPSFQFGLFPQENQSWERAFISAWKKDRNQKLIGYAHSVIRFWDTKYFEHENVYKDETLGLPKSDLLALNSVSSYNTFLKRNIPKDKILKVEAIRYNSSYEKGRKNINPKKNCKILIIGDYQTKLNLKLFEELKKLNFDNKKYKFYFKPHPGFPIDISNFKSLCINIVNDKLEKILTNYEIIIAIDATAASIDALLMNCNLLIYRNKEDLNYSPLKDFKKINYAYSSDDIEKFIKRKKNITNKNRGNFFIFDKNFKRWKKLIDKNLIF